MSRARGRILASGRDGDIYEYAPGLVLRRTRDGRVIEREARIMAHVHALGFPVPRIEDVRAGGTEIVMERIDGPTMVDAFTRRPWTLRRHAGVLADFHRRLHALEAPDWLPQLPDGGDRIVHLDLHPLNVLYGRAGPVLIDWPNASRGRAETDLAQTWLIIESADVSDEGLRALLFAPVKYLLARQVIAQFDRDAIVPYLRPTLESRAADRNVRPSEIDAMRRIVEREERRLAAR